MKIFRTAFPIMLIMLLASANAIAQSASYSGVSAINFKLIILGTQHRADIDVIRKNLVKNPLIKDFVPREISQRHLEYTGSFLGLVDNLQADIQSLSSNRFNVEIAYDKNGQLVMTLRKIQYPEQTEVQTQ